MTVRVFLTEVGTDPGLSFDEEEISRQVATFAASQGITGQAAWNTFVNSLTTASTTAMLKTCQGILLAVKFSRP